MCGWNFSIEPLRGLPILILFSTIFTSTKTVLVHVTWSNYNVMWLWRKMIFRIFWDLKIRRRISVNVTFWIRTWGWFGLSPFAPDVSICLYTLLDVITKMSNSTSPYILRSILSNPFLSFPIIWIRPIF